VSRILMALLLAAAVFVPAAAEARVVVGVGVAPWPYYYPYYPPAYYYPPPPPVVYAPPPVYTPPVTYTAPAAASRVLYYCDNPKGYYPSVGTCNGPWRQVEPPPPKP